MQKRNVASNKFSVFCEQNYACSMQEFFLIFWQVWRKKWSSHFLVYCALQCVFSGSCQLANTVVRILNFCWLQIERRSWERKGHCNCPGLFTLTGRLKLFLVSGFQSLHVIWMSCRKLTKGCVRKLRLKKVFCLTMKLLLSPKKAGETVFFFKKINFNFNQRLPDLLPSMDNVM